MNVVFWLILALTLYAYAGYPLLLMLLARRRGRETSTEEIFPRITVIIAAYNEGKGIAAKLADTLALDYPRDGLEVIVASDGSTDNTAGQVQGVNDPRVRLLESAVRGGKTAAQNLAAAGATGEILVFSDATTVYDKGILKAMARNFADPSVGCVGGELRYVNTSDSAAGQGGGFYWRYERAIKKLESRVSSLIGVSGCCYAVRRNAYEEIPADLISDFVIAQMLYAKGLRTVYEPLAVSYEETNSSYSDEFAMRVRVAVRTLHGIWRMKALLNPFRYGLFSLQLVSHKLLRYLIPVFLPALLVLDVALSTGGRPVYAFFLALQLAFYSAVIAGWLLKGTKYVAIPFYFFITNIALMVGFVRFLSGEKKVLWKPIRK